MVVDFPAPFGPRKPKDCPGATRRLMTSPAVKSPKRRVRPWVQMVGGGSMKLPNLAHPAEFRAHHGFAARSRRGSVVALCVRRPVGRALLLLQALFFSFEKIIDFPNKFEEPVRIFFVRGQSAEFQEPFSLFPQHDTPPTFQEGFEFRACLSRMVYAFQEKTIVRCRTGNSARRHG